MFALNYAGFGVTKSRTIHLIPYNVSLHSKHVGITRGSVAHNKY